MERPPHFHRDRDFYRSPYAENGRNDYRPYPMNDGRGRPRSESRGDGGYDGGRPDGYGGGRSRSRSPRRFGGGPMNHGHHGPPFNNQPGYHQNRGGDWNRGFEGNAGYNNRRDTRMIEPMQSYKVFMMQQDENATPELYQQRYEEYKKKYMQRLMRTFFDQHKKEEWFQERYSPAIRHRADMQKNNRKVMQAKLFAERLQSGKTKICLDEQQNSADNPDTQADVFDNDMENSNGILYVRRIPCACPLSSLTECIKNGGGGAFQHVYLSDPVKKAAFDFDRSAYIVYDSVDAAKEALPKLHNLFVQDGDLFPPFRLQVSEHRQRAALKTPSYMSVPERIAVDYNQALKLAEALDSQLFVKEADKVAYGINAILSKEEIEKAYGSTKQKLDVIIAYLRRVHHYIYYAGAQCLDMGDILHAYPALFSRPAASQRDLDEEVARQSNKDKEGSEHDSSAKAIGGWAAALDEKIQTYLTDLEQTEATKPQRKALVDEVEAKEEAKLESTYKNYGEPAGEDGKHRCRLCTKLFKAMDFVKKHIRNKHPELVVDKIAEVGESFMWEQYREDPNRPLPPYETTNQLPPGGNLQGHKGNSGPRFMGGGGGRSHNFQNGRMGPGGRGYFRDRGDFDNGDRRSGGRYNNGPGRSPSRQFNREPRPPPDADLPVDPRQITKSYQDLDKMQEEKVDLSFDALEGLPPVKKKAKLTIEDST